MVLSKKCLAIAPSMTLEIDAKAKRMKAEGMDVIGFGAGEPDFDTPSFIKEAAKKALDMGMTKYTPASGTLELRKAICDKLSKQNGLTYEAAQIVVSNGAKHSLFNAFAAILNEGDEVIVPSPYWVTYPELIQFNGGKAVMIETREENGFVPDINDLKSALTPKTKAILINSPSNPCGAIFSKELLGQIAELAIENNLFVISDEIYEELVYDGDHISIASLPDMIDRTIVVNGFSKAYAMTGWRLGYTASTAAIAKAMGSLQSHATSNPNSIAQYAGVAALTGPRDEIEAMVREFKARRSLMYDTINAIEGVSCIMPKGAFYVMMKIDGLFGKKSGDQSIHSSMDFCDLLLEDEKVAMVPGIAFGADGYCRLSYATSRENIEKGLSRTNKFIQKLK